MLQFRPARHRALGLLVLALLGPVLAAAPSRAAPTRPTPTTAAQAQHAKQAADRSVAALRARIVAASRTLARLTAAAGRAEDQYNAQLAAQARARTAEAQARADVTLAQQHYEQARTSLVTVLVAYYESGGPAGNSIGTTSTASLFTASDPGEVIQAGADREMITRFQTQVAEQMTAAVAARTAAEARQKAALAEVNARTATLAALRQQAQQSLAGAHAAMAQLRKDLRAARVTQAEATVTLSIFLGGWSTADPAQAAALNARYRRMAAAAANLPLAPARAHWTAAMGQTAADRALRWIGTPYAWAGGNAQGPTRGVCAAGSAEHDCQVVGFDCSGLAMYAWGPYLSMAHFAATQYVQAGRFHPAIGQLLPGDLVFWSSDGTVGGIHHVAVYVGGGNVVQAPQSGDIVRITPLGSVASGYFGATRPLS